jgi:hypothetical protein
MRGDLTVEKYRKMVRNTPSCTYKSTKVYLYKHCDKTIVVK